MVDRVRRPMRATVLATVLLALPSVAGAADPAALVEDVNPPLPGIEFMQSLRAGEVLKLKPGQSVTLAYLASCQRETIVGGTVTIGAERSSVAGTKAQAEKIVPCGTSRLALSTEQAGSAGALVTRGGPGSQSLQLRPPDPTIPSTSPVFMLGAPGALVLERLDRADEAPMRIQAPTGSVDLARSGVALARGAKYRAEAGGRSATFVVDPAASAGGPLLARLVRL